MGESSEQPVSRRNSRSAVRQSCKVLSSSPAANAQISHKRKFSSFNVQINKEKKEEMRKSVKKVRHARLVRMKSASST